MSSELTGEPENNQNGTFCSEVIMIESHLKLYLHRIFRQPQGHLLLIGVSGAGKTTLSRFVAWMNGLSVYQIKVSLPHIDVVAILLQLFVIIKYLCTSSGAQEIYRRGL